MVTMIYGHDDAKLSMKQRIMVAYRGGDSKAWSHVVGSTTEECD